MENLNDQISEFDCVDFDDDGDPEEYRPFHPFESAKHAREYDEYLWELEQDFRDEPDMRGVND